MADFFLSDVHLRLDRPDRAARLVEFLGGVGPDDRLFILGDLCDFWFASREARSESGRCPALTALSRRVRSGHHLVLLTGNHDHWLAPFFRERLGVEVAPEGLIIDSHGLRLTLAHGHLVKGKRWWKQAMEGRAFYEAFSRTPQPIASLARHVLDSVNHRTREASENRMIQEYVARVAQASDAPDLALFGHVHRMVDTRSGRTRVVVLGDWLTAGSYLRVDEFSAKHLTLSPASPSRTPE